MHTRHPFRSVCSALLLALLACAPARAEPLHPALWKVADADTTIWLFGTVHVMKPGLDWLNGPVRAALEGSDELVTEIADPTGTRTQSALMALSLIHI